MYLQVISTVENWTGKYCHPRIANHIEELNATINYANVHTRPCPLYVCCFVSFLYMYANRCMYMCACVAKNGKSPQSLPKIFDSSPGVDFFPVQVFGRSLMSRVEGTDGVFWIDNADARAHCRWNWPSIPPHQDGANLWLRLIPFDTLDPRPLRPGSWCIFIRSILKLISLVSGAF